MRRELLLVVAVALVGAACGDTSAETVATTSSPTAATDADGVSPTTTSVSATTTPTTTPTTEPSDTLAPTTTSTTTVTPTTVPPTTSPPGGRDPSLTELAQQDLARRLGLDQGAISVVVAQDVTWRNGSLGCPEPGMSYSQALVDGFRVVLEVDGVEYAYHSGRSEPQFYCANPAEDGTTAGA